jgi:hypothetical protein
MHARNLSPAVRDRFLFVIDALASNTATLKSRVQAYGVIVVISDLLFEASASEDRLPAMAGEMLRNLYRLTDAPVSYGAAARTVLLEHHALQARRDEEEEVRKFAEAEARAERDAEARKVRQAQAEEAAKKEKARAKAEDLELARRAKLEPKPERTGWRRVFDNGKRAPAKKAAA